MHLPRAPLSYVGLLTLYGHIITEEQRTIHYTAIHSPLMGGLLHLVQRGEAWRLTQSTPLCTASVLTS